MAIIPGKGTRRLLTLIALVVYAKRRFPKASLIWLVKRLLGVVVGRTLPIRIPEAVRGRGKISEVGALIQRSKCRKALVVTDEILVKHGLVQKCLDSIKQAGLDYEVFDKVEPNPPSQIVEQGFERYQEARCDCIVAFGGGSPMDTAKVIGAKVCNPMPIEKYQGFFKATLGGLRSLPPFIAVPTTAGTGSETTLAAIITLTEQKKKIAIVDLGLVPHMAILDPEILEKLPPKITAATGMDALTHAIESYMGGWSTAYTRNMSLAAIGKVFLNVEKSYHNGADLDAREAMLQASFEAGIAFTRANVGYVHAIAHQLGGMFHTPHGDANAMILPHILDYYLHDEVVGCGHAHPHVHADSSGLKCCQQCCEMAVAGGMASWVPTDAEGKRALAKAFVAKIKQMNADMNIPKDVPSMKAAQVTEVATRALAEAHGEQHTFASAPLEFLLDLGYPTPKYMTLQDCESIVRKFLAAGEAVLID